MPPRQNTEIRRTFNPSVGELRQVREFVGSQVPADVSKEDAVILAHLLAKNAVQHARTDFEVGVETTPVSFTIRVRDGMSTEDVAETLRNRPGHGGRILTRLATRWGVENLADGKRIWASLDRGAASGG